MSVEEKIALGILVALEKPDHWRDFGEAYRFHTSKYMPHQGARECARRFKRMQAKEMANEPETGGRGPELHPSSGVQSLNFSDTL